VRGGPADAGDLVQAFCCVGERGDLSRSRHPGWRCQCSRRSCILPVCDATVHTNRRVWRSQGLAGRPRRLDETGRKRQPFGRRGGSAVHE
jgi:hypothetical protein